MDENEESSHRVRYLAPEGIDADRVSIFLLTESGWELADSEVIGSYIAFTVSGSEAEIASCGSVSVLLPVIAALIAIILIVILVLIVRRRKSKKNASRAVKS